MFKVGDKVVITAKHLSDRNYYLAVCEVKEYPYINGNRELNHLIKLSNGRTFHIENITLYDIYNSPLYKLMKEEENA